MLKNYFKIAFRNLWRHRVFSFINILGLTVGMTAGFLIFLYVRFELSYDSFHSNTDRIYRVVSDIKTPTEVIKAAGPNGCSLVSIKLSTQNLPKTIASIENKWNALIPARPFSYYFLDEFFDKQFRSEERLGKLFLNFSVLAIIISCLGLLGLASYSTMQRTREIGIRKVLGASVPNIVNLLSRDFLKLVAIAILIASPIAWYAMHGWLLDFAYRIGIGWWIFVIAGIMAVLIAIATVSYQAMKAAIANPVKSLRVE